MELSERKPQPTPNTLESSIFRPGLIEERGMDSPFPLQLSLSFGSKLLGWFFLLFIIQRLIFPLMNQVLKVKTELIFPLAWLIELGKLIVLSRRPFTILDSRSKRRWIISSPLLTVSVCSP